MLIRFLLVIATGLAFMGAPAVASPPRLVAPEVNAECAAVLRTVEAARLFLPPNFGFRCPDYAGGHLGVSSWNGRTGFVALNTEAIAYYGLHAEDVMAHEICHAQEQVATGTTTETSADACAVAHGFDVGVERPRPMLVAP